VRRFEREERNPVANALEANLNRILAELAGNAGPDTEGLVVPKQGTNQP
jgi:hypothetical protein